MSITTSDGVTTTTLTPTSLYTSDPEIATPIIEIATVNPEPAPTQTPPVEPHYLLSTNFLVFMLFILFIAFIYVLSLLNDKMKLESMSGPVMPVL